MMQVFQRQLTVGQRISMVRLILCILGWFLVSAAVSAATFTAELDRDTTTVGESVNLSLHFSGGQPEPQPTLPEIPNVKQAGLSASQNFSFINGRSTAQFTYTFALVPTKEGQVTIPSITATVGGQVLKSQPLKLTVTKAVTTRPDSPEAKLAFVRLLFPKKELYVGEPVVAEVQVCLSRTVSRVTGFEMQPVQVEGVTMGKSIQGQQGTTQIDGEVYSTFPFRMTITPAKTGKITVAPVTTRMTLLLGQPDFWGNYAQSQVRKVTLESDPEELTVLPLPEKGKPATFSGAIGQFTMQMEAGPPEVAVGDPITVKVQISGRGSLDAIALPPQPAWREFKMYTPNSRVESNDPHGVEGEKYFELVISPQNAAIKELPPFAFSYFDPEQKAYRTLTSPSTPLTVRPTSATPQPTIVSANSGQDNDTPQAKEIVHIKSHIGTLTTPQLPLIQQPWFLGLQAVAPLLWVGSIIYRRQKEKLENNPRLRRQRAVERTVSDGLQKLKEQAAANQSDEFFATVFRILQEQIGERLDMPASAITEAVLDDELKERGLSEIGRTQLHELFDLCNQARYAPVRGSQQLASIIPRVEAVVSELKKLSDEKIPVSV